MSQRSGAGWKRPGHCGLVFCSALLKKSESFHRQWRKALQLHTHTEKGEDCGEELCWGDSFLHSAESAGEDRKHQMVTHSWMSDVCAGQGDRSSKENIVHKQQTYWNLLRRRNPPKHMTSSSLYCDLNVAKKIQIKLIKLTTIPPRLIAVARWVWPTWCSWNSRCCSWNSAPSLASKCDLTLLTPPSLPSPPKSLVTPLPSPKTLQHSGDKWAPYIFLAQ